MTARPDVQHAADMAALCLRRAGVTSLPVNPLPILKRCRGTRVLTVEEAADMLGLGRDQLLHLCGSSEAWTYREDKAGETRYVVVYRTDGRPDRLRFSLAHELGHLVLKHTGEAAWEEQEADVFASHLLCPRQAVAAHVAAQGTSVEKLAQVFYVSAACARRVLQDVI